MLQYCDCIASACFRSSEPIHPYSASNASAASNTCQRLIYAPLCEFKNAAGIHPRTLVIVDLASRAMRNDGQMTFAPTGCAGAGHAVLTD